MAKSKKITIAEWRRFLAAPWPEGHWVDDTSITVRTADGVVDVSEDDSENDMDTAGYERFAPDDEVKIDAGVVYPDDKTSVFRNGASLQSYFNKWRKADRTETIVITIAKGERAEALKQYLTDAGYSFS